MRQTGEIFRSLVLFTKYPPSSGERRCLRGSAHSGTITTFMLEQVIVRHQKFCVLSNSSVVFILCVSKRSRVISPREEGAEYLQFVDRIIVISVMFKLVHSL